MHCYHFALRNDVGDREDLGYLAMNDDTEALDFGRDIIRDITQNHAPVYAGSVMEITAGRRLVGSIALGFEAKQRRKKFD